MRSATGRPGWANLLQHAFLSQRISAFLLAQENKSVQAFINETWETFILSWPAETLDYHESTAMRLGTPQEVAKRFDKAGRKVKQSDTL